MHDLRIAAFGKRHALRTIAPYTVQPAADPVELTGALAVEAAPARVALAVRQ